MKCADAQNALLTAGPKELEGIGDSPVAQHVRGCERCRVVARAILGGQAALAASLEEAGRPAPTAEQAADAVLAAVAGRGALDSRVAADVGTGVEAGARVVRLDAMRRRAARRAKSWRVWAPVALAAALAAVLLARPRHDWQVPPSTSAAASTQVAVSAPPGKSVVVFATRNPDIKVIWFYGSKD